MLEARNLRKSFGSLVATNDVSLQFGKEEGEMVFIVGPNGAGKTTLINLLTGHLDPDEGSVIVHEPDGAGGTREQDITGLEPRERVDRGLVRSFQIVQVFEEMSVRENVRIAVLANQDLQGSVFSHHDRHEGVEREVDELLVEFALEDDAETPAEELPHGDRKLLDVAMSFGLDPSYLLLDEPTSGVGTREKERVIETVVEVSDNQDVTTVTIEHDMDIVSQYADRLIALHQGAVYAEGDPSLLETDPDLRRVLLGVEDE